MTTERDDVRGLPLASRPMPAPAPADGVDQNERTWTALRDAVIAIDAELARAFGQTTRGLLDHDVLRVLATAPGGSVMMSRLSAGLGVSSGGMTKVVDRLVADDLVRRRRSDDDRRVIHVVVTDAGRDQARLGAAARRGVLRRMLGDRLAPSTLEMMRAGCFRVAETRPRTRS